MDFKTSEIASLIKEQIKNYDKSITTDDVGTVVSVGDGIANIYGLDDAMLNELVIFPNGTVGMVLNLEVDSVGVVLLGDSSSIKEGDTVKRTHRLMETVVGDELLGRVINPLGQPLDGLGAINSTITRPIERIAPGVMSRKSVDTPLQTGIKAIDAMIPIGRGQRELIIGDRQTGKTAIAIDTIINQKGKDVICIYVAIGQKNSTVAQIVDKLKTHNALDYTVVLASTASMSAPLLYIAPYVGCAIGEHWLEQGKDVLIVYDDLSKHAVSYRALSLLLKRSPGREAYPGDIFYLHSRLLERACRLNEENGGGSLTALPIVETQAGDISAYIPTNIISITDGQIFLVTDLFNAGQRPAIDSGFSVSRVGGAAQRKAMKQVAGSLKIDLASYNELKSFTQFGSDLDDATKSILRHGEVLLEVLKQNQYDTYTLNRQIVELLAAKARYLENISTKNIRPYLNRLYEFFENKYDNLLKELELNYAFDEKLEAKFLNALQEFYDLYKEEF